MACAFHLGDCELYDRRLERGYSVAWCGLYAVAIIGMAIDREQR